MSRNLSWWATALGIASLAAIIGLAAVTFRNTAMIRASEQTIAESHAARELLNRLLITLQDAETGQRGYLLTGDERYLAPYVDSLERTREIASALKDRIQNGDDSFSRLEKIEELAEKKHAELARTIALRRSAEPDAFDRALEDTLTDEGRQLMVAIRRHVNAISDAQSAKLADQMMHAAERAAVSKWSILLGTLLTLGLVAGAGAVVRLDRRSRREAEARLATERKRLDAIVDASIMGMAAVDADYRVLLANPAAMKSLACDAGDVAERSLLDFAPADSKRKFKRIIDRFVRNADQQFIFSKTQILNCQGTPLWIDGAIVKARIDEQLLLTVMFRDLTTEERHRVQVREQSAVLDQIRDAVHLRDADGRITYWNQGSQALYGWTASEVIGRNARELMSPQKLPIHDEAERAVAEKGRWRGELKQVAQDGREVIVDQRRSALRDDSGRLTGQIVINADITELRKREQVSRRNQRLESVGTLAGGIAHDLNNVLTPIIMGARLLEREQPPENRRQLLTTIRTSAERGAEMIQQLLTFAGGDRVESRSVNVGQVLDELIGILRHTLPKTIAIKVDHPDDLWHVRGDATELSQVLMNLAINARDAMPSGGTLAFEALNLQLATSRSAIGTDLRPGRYVALAIADDGQGIAPDIVERVFDPFFTTKKQGHGTGLGLATSLGIVQAHGGSMAVYSEPGEGTKFTIYLPVQGSEQIAGLSREVLPATRGKGETVLVIDDEQSLLETARMVLEAGGYHALTSSGGEEGLACFRKEQRDIDVVIVDMMMPGMDGQATIDALRAIDPSKPIIASSGLRRPDQGDGAIRGAERFLKKPYTDEQLLGAIDEIVGGPSEP